MIEFDSSKLDWEKGNGLIPTIVQDEAGQVITLAYSTVESLKKAIEEKKGWYFSRSRNKLWKKGETSGNTQELISVKTDCDKDALIFKVKQKEVGCHLGSYSCFGEREFSLNNLWEILRDRKINPKEGSYTSSLFKHRKGAVNKISEKLGEEAIELILSAKDNDRDNVILEAADLIFFINMLLAEKNIAFKDVVEELKTRCQK